MNDQILSLLEESRKREKGQALFYRRLAAEAGSAGDEALAERFNELHADEQHHLSRLTARILEFQAEPREIPPPDFDTPTLNAWEEEARAREEDEVAWYEKLLRETLDESTRSILQEIKESEVHHARELAGKWMSA